MAANIKRFRSRFYRAFTELCCSIFQPKDCAGTKQEIVVDDDEETGDIDEDGFDFDF